MALARATVQALSTIRSRVRRELEDPSTEPAGTAISLPEFSDADIDDCINEELLFLGNHLAANFPGEALFPTALTYTETVTGEGVDLPAAIGADAIYRVEDTGATDSIPREVFPVSPWEIENYQDQWLEASANSVVGRQFWCLLSAPTGIGHRIKIRPVPPSGRTYRIWSIAAPIITAAAADTPLLSAKHRELIALGAAIRLLRPGGRVQDEQKAAYAAHFNIFERLAKRRAEPDRIRAVRGREF